MAVTRDFGEHFDRTSEKGRGRLIAYINLRLSGLGLPVYSRQGTEFLDLARQMLRHYREKDTLLRNYMPPADRRVQDFLDSYLADAGLDKIPRLPTGTLTLDTFGMARELSLPPDAHSYRSPTLSSYRARNGVLHNPASDRRTTQGVFHVAEGGLPVPPDKKAVPKRTFGLLLAAALAPPDELLELPFTAGEETTAKCFLSLLVRPTVQPAVPSWCEERAMELRYFAPGSLAANLDFVESIFGNSGDPYIPANDAALDPAHWTGTTGCILLATHLTKLTKRELGLPRWDEAGERARRDGMAWKDEGEPYNDGKPFKICARDERGVMVSIIADNYFGYSKKEVKAHVSYSANLLGMVEEEHSGGALVFPSYNLGNRFVPDTNLRSKGQTFESAMELLGDAAERHPDGYAVDRAFPRVIYLPEDAVISLDDQSASWTARDGSRRMLRVLPDKVYVHPTGYKVRMERHPGSGAWRLVGTQAEGTLCHKPCTVSGGGKSEISKSIRNAITYQPLVTGDFSADMALAREVVGTCYGYRFRDPAENHGEASRPLLSSRRSLGSVIKLLSPSPLNTDEFNRWLESIPDRVRALVFLVKRFYREDWGDDWESRFSVDLVNATAGNVIKYSGRPVLGSFLRVGFTESGERWTFKLRQDFMSADKIQWEDDITASVLVPSSAFPPGAIPFPQGACKFARNAEARFFQRPDDAIERGYDRVTEEDFARSDNFMSNFEPVTRARVRDIVERCVTFTEFSAPMQAFLRAAADDERFEYCAVPSEFRLVDGVPSKNPRYLQLDPSREDPLARHLADTGTRLFRGIPASDPVFHPVAAVLAGRRNNPADPEAGIRPLAVYGPLHWQELPELFMDFVCSLTGKSPSTTGAGSEGALTKGPFNALVPTTDLNNALLGFILSGYHGWSTAAGYVGRKWRVDHDLSLLAPELWSRMSHEERDPAFLAANGYLERVKDLEYGGRTVPASRLGWRVTPLFVSHFMGRIFDAPAKVFPEDMLRPELQGLEDFVDGVDNIVEAQRRVALDYLADGSVEAAIPPLRAILRCMAEGSCEGKTIDHPELRALFDRETVLASDWYRERLARWRDNELAYCGRERAYVERCLRAREGEDDDATAMACGALAWLDSREAELGDPRALDRVVGAIGLDPLFRGR